jgi:hypothetical protein
LVWLRATLLGLLFSLLRASEAQGEEGSTSPAPEPLVRFQERFTQEIWPTFLEETGTKTPESCLSCHGDEGATPLLLFSDAAGTFKALLSGGYLDAENPSGLLARVTSPSADVRMPPPPHPALEEKRVGAIRHFLTEVYEVQRAQKEEADRRFPAALLERWTPPSSTARLAPDNTFLSYTQLKGKIWSVFADDWHRGEKDLFLDNIAQFGGADFKRMFNESSKPSATFLSAVDRMASDVCSRAYLERSGPFSGLLGDLPSPLDPRAASECAAVVERLFDKVLFRKPTADELKSAREYLRNVYLAAEKVQREGYELSFELTVRGEEGAATTRNITIPVECAPHALHLEWVDTSRGEESSSGKLRGKKIGDKLFFRKGDGEQAFHLSNRETAGTVTFHAVEIRGPLPGEAAVVKITAGDRSIRLSGAWGLGEKDGLKYLSDGDRNKGESSLTIPLSVKEDGDYELFFFWQKPGDPVPPVVPVEVVSSSSESSLGLPPRPPPQAPSSEPREAAFQVDQTLDNIAFQDLHTSFRFGPDSFVEIRNAGTTHRVVADAVKFEPAWSGTKKAAATGKPFLIDNDEAEGQDGWKPFDTGQFRPYNVTGKGSVTDQDQRKGALSLKYRPASKADVWDKDKYYRVLVGFPGKEGNETRAPLVVRAEASSPIVPLRYPYRAVTGAEVVLDASGSYDLQGGKLSFLWKETGGPPLGLPDPAAERIVFRAPPRDVVEEAWAGLCRALVKHPDFLFSAPVSAEKLEGSKARQRLLLVKVATDLVARAPSPEELERLQKGSLEEAIAFYLETKEFQDFYFRRVRLYLESDGTEEGDEPARLWCHVAFKDRSFQEILAGDYTVDAGWMVRPRPDFHGKTGLLTMAGFVRGKPGLPHFNYAAHVAEKFLGYVFEVPPEIVAMRDGITAVSTTSPGTVCYSCHKILTPLAYQRSSWDDQGQYREKDSEGKAIDDTDRNLVPSYPYRGKGMEGFAARAKETERFIRTMIQAHFIWYLGREMRYEANERTLYKRLWDEVHADGFKLKGLIKAILMSPEYSGGLGR